MSIAPRATCCARRGKLRGIAYTMETSARFGLKASHLKGKPSLLTSAFQGTQQ